MRYQFANADKTMIIGTRDDGTQVLIEADQDAWSFAFASKPPPYIAPPQPDHLLFERAAMRVSRFQAMAALMDAGLLSKVNTALAGAGPLAQLAWSEATEFHRNSPTIAGLVAGLGLTEAQVDDLFRAAAMIEA